MVQIIALKTQSHMGDTDNALAVQEALAQRFDSSTQPVTLRTWEVENLHTLRQELNMRFREPCIVVGAGVECAPILAACADFPNVTTAWSGHHVPAAFSLADMGKIDIIHLPAYAVGDNVAHMLGERLVTTPYGVPATADEAALRQAYEMQALDIPSAPSYLTVVLGGDAPDAHGAINHFTDEEAYELGRWMGHHAKEHGMVVLATNGPRTGAYSPAGEKLEDAHALGSGLDHVSQAFLQGMQVMGLDEQQQRFYHFQQGGVSALRAIMGAALTHPPSIAVLPGDSTSMVSESVQSMPPGYTITYHTGAMHKMHEGQLDMLLADGLVQHINTTAQTVKSPEIFADEPAQPAAHAVADHIIQRALSKSAQPQSMAI